MPPSPFFSRRRSCTFLRPCLLTLLTCLDTIHLPERPFQSVNSQEILHDHLSSTRDGVVRSPPPPPPRDCGRVLTASSSLFMNNYSNSSQMAGRNVRHICVGLVITADVRSLAEGTCSDPGAFHPVSCCTARQSF